MSSWNLESIGKDRHQIITSLRSITKGSIGDYREPDQGEGQERPEENNVTAEMDACEYSS